MRYSELKIETQRQAPARARNEGEALLRRAGFLRSEGELTGLGRRALARLEELSQTHAAGELFGLLNLPVIQTESGECLFAIASGGDELLQCISCGYASLREIARFKKGRHSDEAAQALEKVGTPECNTIDALAQYLGVPKEKTAKALMYTRSDGKFVFVVIRGDMQLSEIKLKQLVGDVRAATHDEIVASGAVPGYASPIGLRQALIVVDDAIPASANLVAGANEAGFHLKNTNYGRDYTAEHVADLAQAEAGAACPNCGNPLSAVRAEILNDAKVYHLGNLLEALAEAHHDARGLTLPVAGAPFMVYLMHLPGKELDTRGQAERLQEEWEAAGISVLYDDRDERAGVKFADADLIGCPVRATVGERAMKDGMVELKARTRSENTQVPFAQALQKIQSLTKTIP